MPTRHAKHQQWTPQRLKTWARDLGAHVHGWVDNQLSTRAHPEQAYRTCLGLLNLSRAYPGARLDAACRLANREGLNRLKHVKLSVSAKFDASLVTVFDGVDLSADRLHCQTAPIFPAICSGLKSATPVASCFLPGSSWLAAKTGLASFEAPQGWG